MLLSFLLSLTVAHAQTPADANIIACNESVALEDDTVLSQARVDLNADGSVKSLHLKREAADGLAAFEITFLAGRDQLVREVRPGDVEFVDEETNQNVYLWNISKVETIEGRNAEGDVVTVRVNDHLYSGWAGSTIKTVKAGKELSYGSTSCKGPTLLPNPGRNSDSESAREE